VLSLTGKLTLPESPRMTSAPSFMVRNFALHTPRPPSEVEAKPAIQGHAFLRSVEGPSAPPWRAARRSDRRTRGGDERGAGQP